MKKSKVILLALAFVFAGSLTAFANTNPISNPSEIRDQIKNMVSTIDVSDMISDEERVEVQFIVNNNNEIIVLNVNDETFDGRIKQRLNYKKVDSEDVVKNKIYSLPIVFKKK